jgi:DNA-binding transcriptional regulator/RsmH inhibitor MraZ
MTDTNESDVQVMKVDKRGRVRTPAKRRESLLEEFERSGISGRQFAELAGIKYQTFATWLQKRKRQRQPASKTADTVRWLEAVVAKAGSPVDKNSLVVLLPGGARMEVSDGKQAVLAGALVRALAQPC